MRKEENRYFSLIFLLQASNTKDLSAWEVWECLTIPTEINWWRGLRAALSIRPDSMNLEVLAFISPSCASVFRPSFHP